MEKRRSDINSSQLIITFMDDLPKSAFDFSSTRTNGKDIPAASASEILFQKRKRDM